jgi:5-methylcytosine-specific restriction endonuclease McrA
MKDLARQAAERMMVPEPRGKTACWALLENFSGGPREAQVDPPRVVRLVARARREKSAARAAERARPAAPSFEASDAFLESYAWRRLRMVVLKKRGRRCECCGATPAHGARMNVDHIKPRKLFPELALVEDNLQVLCDDCNHGKGNWDQTDWRPEAQGG